MYHVPSLHVTDGAKGTTGSLQFGTSAVAGAARTSWVQLRAALGAPTPDATYTCMMYYPKVKVRGKPVQVMYMHVHVP